MQNGATQEGWQGMSQILEPPPLGTLSPSSTHSSHPGMRGTPPAEQRKVSPPPPPKTFPPVFTSATPVLIISLCTANPVWKSLLPSSHCSAPSVLASRKKPYS